jgi:predicted nucleotide-binding protein (sugar kinase/HSP70/actin superfamily)
VKAAFHADYGEIETIAHYKAAKYFLPEVDFILDIGGQDMKCLRIREGAISSILLNEACSSGCGSFIEGFAKSLHLSLEDFVETALLAKAPVDLGTKCTVFMNSKVKQAQKEGAGIGDISAGLSYSVIKNAIYKVIKLRDESELGKHILVQGGTFLNNAVLRAFELVTGRDAKRPEIAGLMGAFGAALIALERYQESDAKKQPSSLLSKEALAAFTVNTLSNRCQGCTNQCLLTVHVFSDGARFITGNRCEKANGATDLSREHLPNLMEYKNKRTFRYEPLSPEQAHRGEIGIPRVLNLYENYPFWFTLFTKLGFRVILSSPSSKKLFERGMETVPSESTCYPAKLSHGHVIDLIERGIDTIFYPAIVYEKAEYKEANNHYNCPIVISYPEVVRNNIDLIKDRKIRILTPFLSLNNQKVLVNRLVEELQEYQIRLEEMRSAVHAAYQERDNYKRDMQRRGEETLEYLRREHKRGIVLCGKPYHSDPEINHGIADLINSYGMAVLTEDSIAHLAKVRQKLRVVDQWVYNSRLYRAASLVAEEPLLELIQLNSFGCGLDAVTSDQIEELLAAGGKLYTILKIDEGNNLGAIRIRIRSLKAAIEEREKQPGKGMALPVDVIPPAFQKEMRQTYTILAPQMAPIHFELVQEAARASGYHMVVLPKADQGAVEEGLKYVNNDACFPAIVMIGQLIQALKSGEYDLKHTAVILTQSGGGCRATNYIAFLKLGLKQAGFSMIPVLSLNTIGLDKQPGFRLTPGLIKKSLMAIIYGDLFMRLLNRTRPYERFPGSAKVLHEKWKERAKENIRSGGTREFQYNLRRIVRDFDYLELRNETKPRVGIVGEILLKYHPDANHDLIGILEQGGVEAVVPDLMDYFLYSALNARFRHRYLAGSKLKQQLSDIALNYMTRYRNMMKRELARSDRFPEPTPIQELAQMASSLLSLGNQTGEGWLVAAEMMEFLEEGTNNILCIQPLACLPNHITGKGMFKPLRERYPGANIMPIDYDPGLSYVNQLNRIKLMLANTTKE